MPASTAGRGVEACTSAGRPCTARARSPPLSGVTHAAYLDVENKLASQERKASEQLRRGAASARRRRPPLRRRRATPTASARADMRSVDASTGEGRRAGRGASPTAPPDAPARVTTALDAARARRAVRERVRDEGDRAPRCRRAALDAPAAWRPRSTPSTPPVRRRRLDERQHGGGPAARARRRRRSARAASCNERSPWRSRRATRRAEGGPQRRRPLASSSRRCLRWYDAARRATCRGGARATPTRSSSPRSCSSRRRSARGRRRATRRWLERWPTRDALAARRAAEVLARVGRPRLQPPRAARCARRARSSRATAGRDGPARAARRRPVHGRRGRLVRVRRAGGRGRHERAPRRRAARPRRPARCCREARAADFNQALMELGATVCTARAARCEACPRAPWCASRGAVVAPGRRRGAARRERFEDTEPLGRAAGSSRRWRRASGLPGDIAPERAGARASTASSATASSGGRARAVALAAEPTLAGRRRHRAHSGWATAPRIVDCALVVGCAGRRRTASSASCATATGSSFVRHDVRQPPHLGAAGRRRCGAARRRRRRRAARCTEELGDRPARPARAGHDRGQRQPQAHAAARASSSTPASRGAAAVAGRAGRGALGGAERAAAAAGRRRGHAPAAHRRAAPRLDRARRRARRAARRSSQRAGSRRRGTSVRLAYNDLTMPPSSNAIVVSGAREHNLKDVSLTLPRDALVVITGLSGSGKSSLAFDTIYAEGQRRYVESLSAYARQFLGQMDKPDVDSIEGLSPAISIDQKTTSRNPRSTVGTVTEIYDYLRLLWARVGQPHCHICGKPIAGPVGRADHRPGHGAAPRARASWCWRRSSAGARASTARCSRSCAPRASRASKVDGELRMLEDDDRARQEVQARHLGRRRPARDARRRAQAPGRLDRDGGRAGRRDRRDRDGRRATATATPEVLTLYSEKFACLEAGPVDARARAADLLLQLAARRVRALHRAWARRWRSTPTLVVPDPTLSIGEGALAPWASSVVELLRADHRRRSPSATGSTSRRRGSELPDEHRDLFLLRHERRAASRSPTATATGASAPTRRASRGSSPTSSAATARRTPSCSREKIEEYMACVPCPACKGSRLRPESRAVLVGGHGDPRVHARCRCARALALARRGRADRDRAPHRAADPARDRGAAALPRERRHRLPVDGPRGGDAVGRRGAADPAGDADRLGARRRALRARRAVDRPAPARQLEADRDARAPARPRQHGARRRARRADDARGRPPRRPRARAPASTAARIVAAGHGRRGRARARSR